MIENLYYLAMTEAFIKGKNETDLGKYTLNYMIKHNGLLENRDYRFIFESALLIFSISISIRDKETKKIKRFQAYQKAATVRFPCDIGEEFNKIINGTYEEKVEFMLDSYSNGNDKIYYDTNSRGFFPKAIKGDINELVVKNLNDISIYFKEGMIPKKQAYQIDIITDKIQKSIGTKKN